jgi:hypothetical protein
MRSRTTALIGGAIFILTLVIFWLSPVSQVTDSKYSMLVSESLWRRGTFRLDYYRIPPDQIGKYGVGPIYQLHLVRGHVYYIFPDASAALSVPFVIALNAIGISTANPDGTYNEYGDIFLQTSIAAVLMAALASIFFFTARLVLPTSWSVVLALGAALGTQVWSTGSRSLLMHTWFILILGVVIWMLLAQETGQRRLRPVWLATLLAWLYFVRPTGILVIIAVTIYLSLYYRALLRPYLIAGAAWLAGFVIYSWYNFRRPVPLYYTIQSLYHDYWNQLAANFVSPSRGLFVYVPVLLWVAYLLVRYWSWLVYPRLAVLALTIMLPHMLIIARYWPGHSYGARYSTDLVPWFFLLAVLSVQAWRRWRAAQTKVPIRQWHVPLFAGGLLLALSIFINGRGALAAATMRWNSKPINVDQAKWRIWEWCNPQFLAGLLRPPLPAVFPSVRSPEHIDLGAAGSEKFLWYGWSGAEESFRWTEGPEAAFIFALPDSKDTTLRLKLSPFLVTEKHPQQRVEFALNGQPISMMVLKTEEAQECVLSLPAGGLREHNVLTLKLPDAAAPKSFGFSADERLLGVAVHWLEFSQAKHENAD